MQLIVTKWRVKQEYIGEWMADMRPFTEATRKEPGNLWFEWSKSLERRDEFVLVEAFTDDGVQAHLSSQAVKDANKVVEGKLSEMPLMVQAHIDGDSWTRVTELPD